MEEENIQNQEVPKMTLLEKINQTLKELGSAEKWKRAPEFLESYEPLKDKIVIMVDDAKDILNTFAPYLIIATNGKTYFIEYTNQKFNDLIQQIMEHNPDIIIMDYNLSENLKGAAVIRKLREQNFTGETVGFSSDSRTAKEFIDAGAKGVVDKDTYDPEKSIKELANLFARK